MNPAPKTRGGGLHLNQSPHGNQLPPVTMLLVRFVSVPPPSDKQDDTELKSSHIVWGCSCLVFPRAGESVITKQIELNLRKHIPPEKMEKPEK